MTREQALNMTLFEEALRQEREYQDLESAAVSARQYDAASRYQQHRRELIDAAFGILADLKDMGHA